VLACVKAHHFEAEDFERLLLGLGREEAHDGELNDARHMLIDTTLCTQRMYVSKRHTRAAITRYTARAHISGGTYAALLEDDFDQLGAFAGVDLSDTRVANEL
jgi:hypothetical protein